MSPKISATWLPRRCFCRRCATPPCRILRSRSRTSLLLAATCAAVSWSSSSDSHPLATAAGLPVARRCRSTPAPRLNILSSRVRSRDMSMWLCQHQPRASVPAPALLPARLPARLSRLGLDNVPGHGGD
eukprot:3319763-Rhodomonas_salina.1